MGNVLTELHEAGWTDAQVNTAFNRLNETLDAATSAPGLVVAGSTGWDTARSAAIVSSIFPPGPALTIHSTLDRLAAGGMVPAPPESSATKGGSSMNSLAPQTDPRVRTGASDRPGQFPWAVLADPAAVAVMADQLPGLLGLSGTTYATPDELLLTLGTTKAAPVDGLAQTPGIDVLRDILSASPENTVQKNKGTGEGGGGEGGGGTTSPAPLSDSAQQLLNEILAGLKAAHYEAYWWGYKIRLSRAFCETFPGLLLGTEAAAGTRALLAFLAENSFWAGLSAAALAVGGWVTAAILIYGLYLALSVQLNATASGVWMCGLWGTLTPLWCQGA